jgi:serine/threonine-protein kinase
MPPSKYKVLEQLGAGGMGKVYKGVLIGQSGFQRPIVMKQLRQSDDAGHVRMFVDEARRYAVLDHENIGRIFDFETVDDALCIILEYIDGWSLVEYLERHRERRRLPDVDLSVFITSRVCRALQYVFERAAIVHRDISPSNIMMTREGTVKLIDFGIATQSGTRDSSLTGKPAYMAPEMVVELRADNRSDLFSLGAVLFEMLTLERLFQGKTTAEVLEQVIAGHHPSPRSFNPAIPDGVMAIVRTALQRDATRRYTSAAEMGAACEHFLYDKGYGPTNLTLKQYLHALFPDARPLAAAAVREEFPLVEHTLIPITDSASKARGRRDGREEDKTPVAPLKRAYSVVSPPQPPPDAPPTLAPGPAGPRPRRLRTRLRSR